MNPEMSSQNNKSENCIHCGACTASCPFLSAHGLDLGTASARTDLAYHCFLCGKCTEVCPAGIDGKKMFLSMREELVSRNGGKIPEKGYEGLLWEKEDYKYSNWRGTTPKRVFFPGCNFPSHYPKTCRKLEEELAKRGIGTVFDCCGKPLEELGMKDAADRAAGRIQNLMKEGEILELVTACPNCYTYFKQRGDVPVRMIYELLEELELAGPGLLEADGKMFLPCPDRGEKKLKKMVDYYFQEETEAVENVNCCGLGGCAGGKEPEAVEKMLSPLDKSETLYTYCASCCGNFGRKGFTDVRHVLAWILGTEERPVTSISMVHRAMTRFRRPGKLK